MFARQEPLAVTFGTPLGDDPRKARFPFETGLESGLVIRMDEVQLRGFLRAVIRGDA